MTTNVGRTDSSSSSSSSSSSAYTDSSSSYTDSSSSKKSGWVSDAYGKQYLDSQGEYITGWKEISGKQYYFDDGGGELSDDEAYEKIIALKDSYPEGMSWTNDNSYQSGYRTGYGCAYLHSWYRMPYLARMPKKPLPPLSTGMPFGWETIFGWKMSPAENIPLSFYRSMTI